MLMQMKPLALLAALEARLEEEIAAAALQSPGAVQATEHAREKERRRVSLFLARTGSNLKGAKSPHLILLLK